MLAARRVGEQRPGCRRLPREDRQPGPRGRGAAGALTTRSDSGFYGVAVVRSCRKADVRFSITARLHQGLHECIAAIPEQD